MAELITLLLGAITTLLGTTADPAALSLAMEQSVNEARPAEIRQLEVVCEGVEDNYLEHISFNLEGLLLDPLMIEEASISARGISIDANGDVHMEAITWEAAIAEQALTDALQHHVEAMNDTKISVAQGSMQLAGSYPLFGGLRMPYSVDGTLLVENDTQLVFRIKSSGVSHVPVPAKLNQLIEREINPVYDLNKFQTRNQKEIKLARDKFHYDFKLQIEEISHIEDMVLTSGKA